MEWLKEVFYLHPIATGFLVLTISIITFIFVVPKTAYKSEKIAAALGLKRISLNEFGRYVNNTSCSCLEPMFNGSRFNSPSIGDIYSGRNDSFTVTIFTLVLPTGRTGTRQTVIHVRSDTATWLPIFSIIDEVYGNKISDFLKCEHTKRIPLGHPNFINRSKEADNLRAYFARKPVNELSIKAMKSPLRGIVIDSTGDDLFFYRHGETIEPKDFEGLIELGTSLWLMIETGNTKENPWLKVRRIV